MSGLQDLNAFDFSFDTNIDIFGEGGQSGEPTDLDEVGVDPGIFLPNTEGRTEFLPPDPERVPQIPGEVDRASVEYAERPAEERTRELLAHMHPHRLVLLGVLEAAKTPCSSTAVDGLVEELRAHKFSVYSPANICTMLEQAGALERTIEDGTPYAQYEPRPNIVVEEGIEYWEPAAAPEPYWTTTEAGISALEANNPADRLARTFVREEQYLPIYKRVLSMAAEETPHSMSDFSAAIDSHPLIAKPRVFFVQHFVEQLERCEAVAWKGDGWHITEVGKQGLADLAHVEDDFDATGSVAVELETQGAVW